MKVDNKIPFILLFLFIFMIFSIPFNLETLNFFKGYIGEAYSWLYFYISIILILYLVFTRRIDKKIRIPNLLLKLYIVIIFSIVLTTIINFCNISNNELINKIGYSRLLSQIVVFGYTMVLTVIMYNLFCYFSNNLGYKNTVCLTYRIFEILNLFMIVFCLFEYMQNNYIHSQLFSSISYVFHLNRDFGSRLSFVSIEFQHKIKRWMRDW